MRTKLVAGNWKMNFTAPESAAVIESFAKLVDHKQGVEVLLCPSYLSLWKARESLKSTKIHLGAQDVFWMDSGAFTGRVSPPMLKDAGVSYCIVGHSETRGRFGKLDVPESTVGYFAETDETVNLKLKALLFHSIKPIMCCGETLAEREAGKTDEIIKSQIVGGLAGIEGEELFGRLVVAYEPVWAIGTGKTCDTPEAERICGLIRDCVKGLYGERLAEETRILYGGSVKSSNSTELFRQPNIDGGLVGGASMNAEEFSRIVMGA